MRTAALAAFVRVSPDAAGTSWRAAIHDRAPAVRRRCAELAPAIGGADVMDGLFELLTDHEVTVVEAAAWAVGELGDDAVERGAVDALAHLVAHHRDALAREAAVAALGALGAPSALPAILDACTDKPAVRRRAVLALAPFDGPEVDAAIEAALEDRDWQVRQAAEDLL